MIEGVVKNEVSDGGRSVRGRDEGDLEGLKRRGGMSEHDRFVVYKVVGSSEHGVITYLCCVTVIYE